MNPRFNELSGYDETFHSREMTTKETAIVERFIVLPPLKKEIFLEVTLKIVNP